MKAVRVIVKIIKTLLVVAIVALAVFSVVGNLPKAEEPAEAAAQMQIL